jgi:hypothetical protein
MDVPLCALTQALETFCKVRARMERASQVGKAAGLALRNGFRNYFDS